MGPGYKQSVLLKAGIKINPIGIGSPGSVCKRFKIVVTKTTNGKEKVQRGKDEIYPEKSTKTETGVYDKIREIEAYYFEKLTQNHK